MDNDDLPIGQVLTRREALVLIGASGLLLLAGCTPDESLADNGTCVVRPVLTEGPYFVDEMLNRSDIRSDPGTGVVKPGALLALTFNVSRLAANACTPLEGAQVDVWHCDHLGAYSDVSDPGFNTAGQKFLRGHQLTDANGTARFTTIFPGWYPGRAVHIHFKVRRGSAPVPGFDFTSQVFFADALIDQVFAQAPYASKGSPNVRNANDGIYRGGGSQLLLNATQTSEGVAATLNLAVQI